MSDTITEMRKLWNRLSKVSRLGFISHLSKGATWDETEFHMVGVRFVNKMIERFEKYGGRDPTKCSVLEIGCGVGRFLKPLSCRFRQVIGVDISKEMLRTAKKRCECLPNIEYILTDGSTLPNVSDGTLDFVVSAGVFQHITDRAVILSYIQEALRVLKPDGLFLFQFEGNRVDMVGEGQRGAKITAKMLQDGLANHNYAIREQSCDPNDRVRNVVIVLQKCAGEKNFMSKSLSDDSWLTGIYNDVQTPTLMHERQAQPPLPLTFFDEE